ncbi:DNA cytosine methyltransferase [Actinomadura luteofluorescens]|uniref:DNA (Cytosine-5)-methyltransferase 1 n=1 Tax=Actinomadura luteofluorescens TaxID=46163 RepID=A0A7Y9EDJ5_9ACTN|nr:DNA cytosine methyltransferase [Actinomadura luteofluorescens]NYD45693.1 DNA (cytosine-5)-methyltransferase 1 [Actinomadura luteofluorescens]NYD45699.1 DNA (cytosine-5)-methyltransferase 1 [Actinomadura luteofluorescens]NYD45705.1 DNA (cytosine-5)-methyltransferase 1 [Actinomadura luteofluorescens]
MTRPAFLLPDRPWNGLRILDLFAGAAGAGMGFWLAGFEVTAVDIHRQPRNPFPFIQADALEVLADRDFVEGFDAVHSSPICQSFAAVTDWRGSRQDYPDLLTPTLALLNSYGLPWIVENVVEAARFGPLRADHVLCGTQFGRNVRRHRAFQTGNWDFFDLVEPCRCHRNRDLVPFGHKNERAFADAMGCTWMTNLEARQAIPPAYTHWLGTALAGHLNAQEVTA